MRAYRVNGLFGVLGILLFTLLIYLFLNNLNLSARIRILEEQKKLLCGVIWEHDSRVKYSWFRIGRIPFCTEGSRDGKQ